jgi:GH24 family phage-related lysozyme (muramidase)
MSFYDSAADFIKVFEGFTPNATWDVNAYRLGHGSDTITLPDGSYRKVVKGDTTTKELAAKDLARRIKEGFEPKVRKQIGEPYYSNLPDPAKISLISLAYNYGSITKPAIIDAARSGDVEKLANAIIESTKNDNKGKSFYEALRKRREKEANYAKSILKKTVAAALKGVQLSKDNPIPTALITIAVIVGGYILIKTIKK